MSNPLVSVLMTSFNREKYIAEAIESVLASTFTDFELIIVDDQSSDHTVSIAKGFECRDSRIRVFINAQNLGDYPNRNKAATYATGKYLKYLDADDYMYPWGLEVMVNCMERFPEAGWGLCSMEYNYERWFPFELSPAEIYDYHNFRSGIFQRAPLSMIIKREVFEKSGGFSGKKQMSDYEMWHLLALRNKLVLMPQGMVWYREHDEQQSVEIRNNVLVGLRYDVAALNFYRSDAPIPLSDEKKHLVIKKYRYHIFSSILKFIIKGKFRIAFKMYQLSKSREFDFKTKTFF